MRHEILYLNQNRSYVLVNEVWYDTHRDLNPKVGQFFLNGNIEEVLDFETYQETYPESKKEMYKEISDKTPHQGYIRKSTGDGVSYAVTVGVNTGTRAAEKELAEDIE